MDLISRKSVAEKMARRRDYVGRPSDPDCIIADEPSVPAVPVHDISVWLAAYAAPPKYAIDEIAGTDPGRIVTVDTLVKAWEYHWKYLMECGLLQEEQNGTDNP